MSVIGWCPKGEEENESQTTESESVFVVCDSLCYCRYNCFRNTEQKETLKAPNQIGSQDIYHTVVGLMLPFYISACVWVLIPIVAFILSSFLLSAPRFCLRPALS